MHTLGDELGSAAAEQRYELFFELLMDPHRPPHPRPRGGEGAADDLALAQSSFRRGGLPRGLAVGNSGRDKAETRRSTSTAESLILDTLARVAARRRGHP